MIILLSPTKTFNNISIPTSKKIYFSDETKYLLDKLQTFTVNDFINKFKISEKLANETYHYYLNIHNKYKAIYLYGGTSFKNLDALNLDEKNLKRVYILSALYGILNANTGISPYRFEMLDSSITNLYKYWGDLVTNFLVNKNELIINLASKEYSHVLDFNKLNIITIDFKVLKNDKLTSSSMMLKKMRGLMANYIIKNDINDLNSIKNINIDGFIYKKLQSSNNLLVFIRGGII